MSPDVAIRFWAKVDRSGGPDACWPWMASCEGRHNGPRGEGHPYAKLTAASVAEMRRLLAAGARQADLAALFEIDNGQVSRIANRKAWAHVD